MWFLPHRHEDDVVEISAQLAAKPIGGAFAAPADGLRRDRRVPPPRVRELFFDVDPVLGRVGSSSQNRPCQFVELPVRTR